ncbi:aminodeoxychorismate lyase [Salinisphaera hydrothermalis]|uniref:aminodeoxychorismate lyase n=1 Tax=Salinisphaera hydrothermalis TaxID=563188 RepID=UPI00334092E0
MAEAMLIDGRAARELPADDRGLAYGDGIFRTLRMESGRVVAWPFHHARLMHDCAALELEAPSRETLEAELRILGQGGLSGVLKITITRGSGGRGYAPPGRPTPRRILSLHAGLPPVPDALAMPVCPITLATPAVLAGVKHLNRLEQVLARRYCERQDIADAVMCDAHGQVVCTTMRNLMFIDRAQRWYTPDLARAGVIGATRERLRARLPDLVEATIDTARLSDFRAAVACNSVGGAVAVTQIGRHEFADSRQWAAYANELLGQSV